METIQIDLHGDVRLIVRSTADSPKTFLISSAILRLASPVFGRQLSPAVLKLRARRGEPPLTIQLNEDCSSSFKLLLEILHMKPVPGRLALPDLIKLAKLVEKYECARTCRFQAEKWMKENLSGYHEDLPEYLGLAIAFRSHDVFNTVSIGLALTNRFKKSGVRSTKKEFQASVAIPKTALGNLVPERAINAINELTQDYTKQLLDAISDLPKKLAEKFDIDGNYKEGHSHSVYCEHDMEVLETYYTCLNRYSLIRPSGACVLSMMHDLTVIEDAVNRSNQEEEGCTACAFSASLEEKFFIIVKDILHSRPGAFLHDALPAGTVSKWRRNPWFDPEEDERDPNGCVEQLTVLFGNILGGTFRERGDQVSFDILVGERPLISKDAKDIW